MRQGGNRRPADEDVCAPWCIQRQYTVVLSSKSVVGQMTTQWQSNHYRLVQVCANAILLCLDALSSLTRCIVTTNNHGNVAMNFIFSECMLDIRVLLSYWYSLFLCITIFVFSVTVIFKKNSSIYYSCTSVLFIVSIFFIWETSLVADGQNNSIDSPWLPSKIS